MLCICISTSSISGSQTSKFLPIDDAECGNKCDKAGASASACVCDLASRGQPTCGCDPGQHVKAINGKDGCVSKYRM